MSEHTLTRIELLRHGEPEGGECLRGHVDPVLTPQGRQQMAAAVADLSAGAAAEQGQPWTVISSDLRRCADFARKLAQSQGWPLSLEPQWRELNFGQWDGVAFSQLWQQHGEALGSYWADPWTNTPPDGEAMQEFASRIETAWDKLLAEHQGGQVLLVTHAGVLRHLLAVILQMPLPGTAHLSALSLPYAARLSVEVWTDADGRVWPKLLWPAQPSESVVTISGHQSGRI